MTTPDNLDLKVAAQAAAELTKAIRSGEFAAPEFDAWRVRAADALNLCAQALGLKGKAK